MLTLGVDTSLPILSVALLDDSRLLGAIALEGKGSRNEKLLPAIDFVLTENHVDRKSIELFAVTRGPGSFTGVRIGLATVQGLALALGKPVIAMSTHEALVPGPGSFAIVDDAGRGEFYVSVFEHRQPVVAPRLATAAELEELTKHAKTVLNVADFLLCGNNAAFGCARRALAIAHAGEQARYADATPIYVRLAEADVKLQQQKRNE
jgi:tRNA threonylcarbamoyladenosine biosynthesis protein TsaB